MGNRITKFMLTTYRKKGSPARHGVEPKEKKVWIAKTNGLWPDGMPEVVPIQEVRT